MIRPPSLLMQQVKHTPERVERIYQLPISGDELLEIPLPRCEYPGGWLWAMPRTGLTLLPRGPYRCLASDLSAGSLSVARRPPGAGAP